MNRENRPIAQAATDHRCERKSAVKSHHHWDNRRPQAPAAAKELLARQTAGSSLYHRLFDQLPRPRLPGIDQAMPAPFIPPRRNLSRQTRHTSRPPWPRHSRTQQHGTRTRLAIGLRSPYPSHAAKIWEYSSTDARDISGSPGPPRGLTASIRLSSCWGASPAGTTGHFRMPSCFTRCLTMREIRSHGIGSFNGNCKLPLGPAYRFTSFSS